MADRIPLPDDPCKHCDTFGWCCECGCVAVYDASARQLAAFEEALENLPRDPPTPELREAYEFYKANYRGDEK